MSAADATGSGVRAYDYALGRVWDACQGLTDAYKVDTGQDLDMQVPTWDQLTPLQQHLWSVASGDVVKALVVLLLKIGDGR